MNNDEKKISAAEEAKKGAASAKKQAPATKKSSGGLGAFWKNSSTGVKAAIISAVALVVIIPIVLVFALTGDGGFSGTAGVGGAGGQKTSYSVTVVTDGGMPLSEKPVYIYEYIDGSIGNLVTGGYAATNEKGKATFSLPKNGSYAAVLSIPEGYNNAPFYPLVEKDMEIKVSSSVIPESSLVGVSYSLGDIIRDFTVNTTEGTPFNLSSVLEEKEAVVINFWGTGCTYCIEEFPYMQSAYEKYEDKLAIIALDPPAFYQDTIYDISSFMQNNGLNLTFDVALDTVNLFSAFSGIFEGTNAGLPVSVVIDRYGVIAMIEIGAITSERAFEVVFEHFTAENYEQKLITNYEDIVPKEKPNVQMPSSDEMSEVFDGGNIEGIEYLPYPSDASQEEKEYSWPFLIGQIGEGDDAEKVIYSSNKNKESSYAQLIIEVPLKAGQALAFDYFASTEIGADILYVVVDGKDIYSIAGESREWKTCYAYVAEEDATYELGLVYSKDSSENTGEDTVYLKNLRVCDAEGVDEPTYIYRFAVTNPDRYGVYQDYVEIYLGSDGYYHVDSETGPLLLANLMGYSRFSDETTAYYMSVDYLAMAQEEYDNGRISEAEYNEYRRKYDRLIQYCNYATNATVYGVSPVTEELMELLIELSMVEGGVLENEKDYRWLEFCCYYDSYGTNNELEDPIKGLATFSAYTAVLSTKGSKEFPNKITYDRMIMPRGLFSKFTPTQSGTYLITSNAPGEKEGTFIDCEAWIFVANDFGDREAWYTYENADRNNIGYSGDMSNVYMIAYFEAGKDYYINIAYADVYQEGTINFRIERLGGEGYYRFSLASPGYYSSLLNNQGELTQTISGGIDLVLGEDGYWREKREDDREGSLLYADFEKATGMFDYSIKELIDMGAFNLATTEDDEYILAIMKSNQAYNYYLNLYLKDLWGDEYDEKYEEYKVSEVLAGVYHGKNDKDGNPTQSENDKYILELRASMATNMTYNNHDNFKAFLKFYWGDDSYAGYMEEYKVNDVLEGIYHGNGEDYTDEITAYLDKVIKVGSNDVVGNVSKGDERIGCVVVDAELAELLQVIMYKYSFEGIENSWAKLCYYHQYFCAETPN